MRLNALGLGAVGLALPAFFALYSCGSNGDNGGGGGNGDDASSDDGGAGFDSPQFGDGGGIYVDSPPPFADGSFNAGDCPGCPFPPENAPACPGAPPINVVYPIDSVLVPPNMNVISVMWTPFGAPFKEFEVDFKNGITDMRVITKCAAQTVDTEQPGVPSGGCELQLDPTMWAFVANQNRGGDPVNVTVRGTTDMTCASTSANSVRLGFAQDDVLGAIYYWKSTVTASGVGGQVWVKSFGDSTPEQDVTSGLGSTCNGCHALSRDGLRMVINKDDDDSDDEYADVRAALIDMATRMQINGGAIGPDFASFYPDHTKFVASNGLGSQQPPTNLFRIYDGNTGALQSTVNNVGAGSAEPTMPDWSPDGKSVVFVMPTAGANWTGTYGQPRNDDDHIFGGSLFTMAYSGNTFAPPVQLLPTGGENNYYPGYSPDGQLIVFDRAPHDTSVPTIDGCSGTAPQRVCPNDSFSNPAARVMLLKTTGGNAPVDLEAANGSPATAPLKFSNSWPKWSPFLQNYKGDKLLWIAFSSTRDYGLRVRNHQPGMFQCYPSDSYEDPGSTHGQKFQPNCQQPQLWMAAIDVTVAIAPQIAKDPSRVAFWLPFQDITTHNHTPQWTQSAGPKPDAGACVQVGGNCTQGGTCCTGLVCQANGTCGALPQ